MRLIGAASIVFALALTLAVSASGPSVPKQQSAIEAENSDARSHRVDSDRRHRVGQRTFRYDTFGDEQLWTDVLRMHEVLAAVPPATALSLASRSTSKLCPGRSSPR